MAVDPSYYVDGDGDQDWNGSNNQWSNVEGGAGGAGGAAIPTTNESAYFSDTSSVAPATLSANSAAKNLYTLSADTGGTDDWTSTLTIGTYDLDLSGELKMGAAAALVIGSSTNTGLSCTNFIIVSTMFLNFQIRAAI